MNSFLNLSIRQPVFIDFPKTICDTLIVLFGRLALKLGCIHWTGDILIVMYNRFLFNQNRKCNTNQNLRYTNVTYKFPDLHWLNVKKMVPWQEGLSLYLPARHDQNNGAFLYDFASPWPKQSWCEFYWKMWKTCPFVFHSRNPKTDGIQILARQKLFFSVNLRTCGTSYPLRFFFVHLAGSKICNLRYRNLCTHVFHRLVYPYTFTYVHSDRDPGGIFESCLVEFRFWKTGFHSKNLFPDGEFSHPRIDFHILLLLTPTATW